MSLITQVKMDQSLVVGEFVQWDTQQLQFVRCTDHMNMLRSSRPSAANLIEGSYVGVMRQGRCCSCHRGR